MGSEMCIRDRYVCFLCFFAQTVHEIWLFPGRFFPIFPIFLSPVCDFAATIHLSQNIEIRSIKVLKQLCPGVGTPCSRVCSCETPTYITPPCLLQTLHSCSCSCSRKLHFLGSGPASGASVGSTSYPRVANSTSSVGSTFRIRRRCAPEGPHHLT